MWTRLNTWFNERWPLKYLVRLGLEEEIPGGGRFAYVFGSMLLFTFIIQLATGILQLFYYVPSVMYAYDSLSYLRVKVPFGWLIHGLHFWGANAMIILLVCHVIRVFIWGAYKQPRELTWLSGVLLFFVTFIMSFTGAPLPWDEKGYWAAEVGTSIASTVPYIGNFAKRIVKGGDAMGQLTLSRMFIVHAAIIPGLLMGLIFIHLIALRKFGSVGPWNESKRKQSGLFWPDQAWRDMLASMLLFLILVAIIVFSPPPFTGAADPLDTSYVPKPEWNFLFLYQALTFFPGKLEAVGTLGLPLTGFLILVAIPFLDRRKVHDPAKRPVAMTALLLAIVALVALTVAGFYSNPAGKEEKTESHASTPAAAPKGGQPGVPPPKSTGVPGMALFQSSGCSGCHKIDGKGGSIGPDLSNEGGKGHSREWLTTQIRNPKAHDPQSVMPPFPNLSGQQASQLVDYLEGLKRPGAAAAGGAPSTRTPPVSSLDTSVLQVPGEAAFTIGSASHGAVLFERNCRSCHGSGGAGQLSNPGSAAGTIPALHPIARALYNADAEAFAANLDNYIQRGSKPAGPHPAMTMPAFGRSQALTQQEISNLEAYILWINGVDRGELVNPGMPPRLFLALLTGLFLLICMIAGGVVLWNRHKSKAAF